MYTLQLCVLSLLAGASISQPLKARQAQPCFLVGSTALPAETQEIADELAASITCDTSSTPIGNVPDVKTASGTTFSSIDFSTSGSTPLQFALDKFATADPLASSDLATFQDNLDVYLATEAGIRSEGGSLAIKVPKFFLAFQVARIKTAQGIAIEDPGQTVEHLLGKVQNNAKGENSALLDQVNQLATQLA
ncbi:hypothetical protein BU24DRAFT_419052 [Aaosphaeria arxii CBS 175.79]|uniref:DUF7143 domain-containing protein n=1 Tax=Aaosphaeria arxii CBS 175.79 TaxID=1450172 RepID=A0A6A5Y2I1_9PLEO|nr:uncharacterized protein BU24DRAFT_419052 [Aaosphaeria arxii CBS 175.79]KAF2019433.1 hypothetical protein BU24DRAFT_419052 [Aaosphaeria arxii CBS 175.79]